MYIHYIYACTSAGVAVVVVTDVLSHIATHTATHTATHAATAAVAVVVVADALRLARLQELNPAHQTSHRQVLSAYARPHLPTPPTPLLLEFFLERGALAAIDWEGGRET